MNASVVSIGNNFSNRARDKQMKDISDRKLALWDEYCINRLALLNKGNKLLKEGSVILQSFGILSSEYKEHSKAEREHWLKEQQLRNEYLITLSDLERLELETAVRWGMTPREIIQ